MLKITSSVWIDSSIQETWSYLSDLEILHDWSEVILKSECIGIIKRGIDAERVCNLKNNITINEKIIEWEEGKTFTYVSYNVPLVKCAKNKWSVNKLNGKTLVTSESEIIMRGGILGRILEPLMLLMSKKMCFDSLAAFKYLVENNKPYNGKHSKLPINAISC